MSPSASSSYQKIETKAEELGIKHFQNMMNAKEPTDHPSITALAKLAKSLKIDVSTLKYTDFVQQHAEQLPAMLEECHNMENFKPFIKLLVSGGFLEDPDANFGDIKKGWATEYQGDAPRQLLNIVLNERKGDVAYCNSALILQTSGYGKSRALEELEKLITTMPMNICSFKGVDGSSTYPYPADEPLLGVLYEIYGRRYATLQDAVDALHTFFAILFERITIEIVSSRLDKSSAEAFALSWQMHLRTGNLRREIYDDVNIIFSNHTGPYHTSDYALKQLRVLLALIPPVPKINEQHTDLHLIMYMDDAQSIPNYKGSMKIKDSRCTLLEVLNKALTEYVECGMFVLFASSEDVGLVRVINLHPYRREKVRPIAPITEMPFDCHRSLLAGLQPGAYRLEDVQKFSFIARFGRPLFWTLLESFSNGVSDTAERKILQLASYAYNFCLPQTDTQTDTEKLAVLDTLLCLEYYSFSTKARKLQQEMIGRHMRTVFTAAKCQLSLHSGYPSEPVLAEAALNIVHLQRLAPRRSDFIDDPMARMFTSLDDDTSEAINMGQRGENVGKMILLQAYMNAVKESGSNTPWRKGCSVVSFLRHLLVQTKKGNVECSLPDNMTNGKELKEEFKDAWIRFTHFVRGADETAMSSSMAYASFLRGMAVIGCNSQDLVDVMIPILLRKDLPICEDVMSGLLVQFKCQSQRGSANACAIEESAIEFFPPIGSNRDNQSKTRRELSSKRSYIALVMELGVAPTANPGVRTTEKIVTDEQRPKTARRNSDPIPYLPSALQRQSPQIRTSLETHPRYAIFAYGCSSDVYSCIPYSKEATERCRRLLYADHATKRLPRTDHIRGTKPSWSSGRPACFSWVPDEFLNGQM